MSSSPAGMFLTSQQLGDEVKRGDVLGDALDPLSDNTSSIISPNDGVVIGMAVPTVVYTGDALFHLGLEKLRR